MPCPASATIGSERSVRSATVPVPVNSPAGEVLGPVDVVLDLSPGLGAGGADDRRELAADDAAVVSRVLLRVAGAVVEERRQRPEQGHRCGRGGGKDATGREDRLDDLERPPLPGAHRRDHHALVDVVLFVRVSDGSLVRNAAYQPGRRRARRVRQRPQRHVVAVAGQAGDVAVGVVGRDEVVGIEVDRSSSAPAAAAARHRSPDSRRGRTACSARPRSRPRPGRTPASRAGWPGSSAASCWLRNRSAVPMPVSRTMTKMASTSAEPRSPLTVHSALPQGDVALERVAQVLARHRVGHGRAAR